MGLSQTAMLTLRRYVLDKNPTVCGLSVTNKNQESGAYETPEADSHINNQEWIIQKSSDSNPSNNILSCSLSVRWGLKHKTNTETNTLEVKGINTT